MSLCSFAALRKDAQALLALINKLPQSEWEKRLHGIFVRDPVQGPLAVAWMLQQVLKASTRQDAPFWCGQIDACKHAARVGHKVRCGWEAYGMTPYEVCMHRGYFRHPIYLGITVSLCSALSPSVLSPVAYGAPVPTRSLALSSCASGRPWKSPGGTLGSP